MKTTLTVMFLAVASIACDEPAAPEVDTHLVKGAVDLATSLEGLSGRASWYFDPEVSNEAEKFVDVEWKYMQGSEWMTNIDKYAVAYWPTEVASFEEDKLIVAGKDCSSGAAVLEVWEFSIPEIIPPPLSNPMTGETVSHLLHVSVKSKRRVYTSTNDDAIRLVFRQWGLQNTLLVQFEADRNIYSFDIVSKQMSLVVNSQGAPGGLSMTELQALTGTRYGFRHSVEGFVYMLGWSAAEPDVESSLYLFDSNEDGVIDEASVIGIDEFVGRQLGNGDLVVDYP